MTGKHATGTYAALTRRTLVAAGTTGALAGLCAPFIRPARAAPTVIRYATGGGIGPNEMETVIYLDWMQKNVLKGYGKDYTVDMTFTRGTPEAGTLLAAGQADMATLSFAVFATSVIKNIVPGGMTIVSDNYQDGRAGFAQNTFFVLKDSPINSTQDLKGKKVGVNAFGSAVDLALRVKLKKDGIDPRKDLTIVEVAFPNQAAALREKRIDAGSCPAVHERRDPQGRPARALHRRRRIRSLFRDLPGRHQRFPEEESRSCEVIPRRLRARPALVLRSRQSQEGDRDHRGIHQIAGGRAGFLFHDRARLLPRSQRLRLGRDHPDADRRDVQRGADRQAGEGFGVSQLRLSALSLRVVEPDSAQDRDQADLQSLPGQDGDVPALATSTSRSGKASSSPSSAPPAAARARCFISSAASSAPTAARSRSTARR